MKPETKYWIEDNKEKLSIAGAVVILIIVITVSFFFYNKQRDYAPGGGDIEIEMADFILAHSEDDALKLFDTESGDALDSLEIGKNDITFYGSNLTDMYLYQNKKINKIEVDKRGNITTELITDTPDYADIINVKTNGNYFGFLTPKNIHVLNNTGEEVLSISDNTTDVYSVTEKGIYLGIDHDLYFVSYEDQEKQYIDIGDKTTKITEHNGTIVVRNDFGSGKDTESILNLTDGSLHVDSLKRVPFDNKLDLEVPSTEGQLVYVNQVKNKEDKITRQTLSTIVFDEINSDVNGENDDLDLTEFEIPVDSDGIFTPDAKSIKGFIYDSNGNELRILEMRNGREVTKLNIGETTNYVPAYK